MRILAISGSLRANSKNTALLKAMMQVAPPEIEIELFQGMVDLPLFNPDLEANEPAAVMHFKAQINAADALIIASPEYAHGVTGVMKNALDWLVSSETVVHKSVAVLNASPRASHADAALRETLSVMSACIVEDASATVPIIGANLDEESMVSHPTISAQLQAILCAMQNHFRQVN